jgi:hypothetical protein
MREFNCCHPSPLAFFATGFFVAVFFAAGFFFAVAMILLLWIFSFLK